MIASGAMEFGDTLACWPAPVAPAVGLRWCRHCGVCVDEEEELWKMTCQGCFKDRLPVGHEFYIKMLGEMSLKSHARFTNVLASLA